MDPIGLLRKARHLKIKNGTSQIKGPMRAKRKCPWQMEFVCTL